MLADPWIQGMGLACLWIYAAGLAWLRARSGPARERLRLGALAAALAIVVSDWLCRRPAHNPSAMLICFGAVAGLALGFWRERAGRNGVDPARPLAFWLAALLAASVFVQNPAGPEYFYRGVERWTGIWRHPNVFGALLAAGVLMALAGLADARRPAAGGPPGWRWGRLLAALGCGLSLPVLAWGWWRSYSRGAWLSVAVAVAWVYLCRRWSPEARPSASGPARLARARRLRPFALPALVLALLVLAFWAWRNTEIAPVRRVFSAANPNDFSWRNRATSWLGGLQIVGDHPWLGVGWARVDSLYNAYYRPARLADGGALGTNDPITAAAALGLPASAGFALYFCLSLAGRARFGAFNEWFAAAALGALVTAWFDSSWLMWPGAVLGFAFLEIGASRPPEASARALPSRASGWGWSRGPAASRALLGLALAAALAALAVTGAQLGLPRLRATPRVLDWARAILVTSGEQSDFEFLRGQADWRREPLRALLDHLRLARYNRELANWQIEEPMFREFVLSPKIDSSGAGLNWRRTLWEQCRPQIRREETPAAAAAVVVSFLRSRVTVSNQAAAPVAPGEALERQAVIPDDFERLYLAALRASGVPARRGADGRAELWSEGKWAPAPRPLAERLQVTGNASRAQNDDVSAKRPCSKTVFFRRLPPKTALQARL